MSIPTTNDQHDDDDLDKDRHRDNAMDIREQREDLANAIDRVKATLELRVTLVKLEAKFLHGRYEGLLEAGFNENQAMNFLLHGWESDG